MFDRLLHFFRSFPRKRYPRSSVLCHKRHRIHFAIDSRHLQHGGHVFRHVPLHHRSKPSRPFQQLTINADYVLTYLVQAYPSTPIDAAWTVANIPNLNSRAMLSGIYVSVSNCSGFVSSNIYLEREAPRYILSLRVNIAMGVILIASVTAYSMWMRWENRRRDKAAGTVAEAYSTAGVESTRDPRFRFQP